MSRGETFQQNFWYDIFKGFCPANNIRDFVFTEGAHEDACVFTQPVSISIDGHEIVHKIIRIRQILGIPFNEFGLDFIKMASAAPGVRETFKMAHPAVFGDGLCGAHIDADPAVRWPR